MLSRLDSFDYLCRDHLHPFFTEILALQDLQTRVEIIASLRAQRVR